MAREVNSLISRRLRLRRGGAAVKKFCRSAEVSINHDEFVGQVQARARLSSRGDAERIIRATLETLAERLDPGFADNLAAQLPQEIGRHLLTDVSFERLSLDDFFKRVGAREGGSTELPDTVFHARCVMEVLQLAVTPGLVEKLHEVLPADFEPLLEGSQGRLERGAGSQPARTG